MKSLTTKILESCRSHLDEIVAIRRDIHMYPETGFDVHRTAGIVAKQLEDSGLKVRVGVGQTGVVGDINVVGATKRIALRADMDALPMQELGIPDYKSRIKETEKKLKGKELIQDYRAAILSSKFHNESHGWWRLDNEPLYKEANEKDLVSVLPGLKVHRDTFLAMNKMSAAASREGINLVLLSVL